MYNVDLRSSPDANNRRDFNSFAPPSSSPSWSSSSSLSHPSPHLTSLQIITIYLSPQHIDLQQQHLLAHINNIDRQINLLPPHQPKPLAHSQQQQLTTITICPIQRRIGPNPNSSLMN